MGVLSAWLVEIGLITWRDLSNKTDRLSHTINGFPLPADYLATFVVFGSLGLVPKDSNASKAATLAAWAFVVATYINALPGVLNPSGTSTKSATTGTNAANSPQPSTGSTTITSGGSNAG